MTYTVSYSLIIFLPQISPLGDPRVQALFVRNLNKSPLEREASAIQDWLSSDKVSYTSSQAIAEERPVLHISYI